MSDVTDPLCEPRLGASLVDGAASSQVQVKPTGKSKKGNAKLNGKPAKKKRPHPDDEPPDPLEDEPEDANDDDDDTLSSAA